VGLGSCVEFELGDELAMPFTDALFDGAYSTNVSMNVADKPALCSELRRVEKPGRWLLLSEIAQGPGAPLEYPTPWAASARYSFLCTPEETRRGLEAAGFELVQFRGTVAEAEALGARRRARVDLGEKPPHLAVQLIHGDNAPIAMKNSARSLAEERTIPLEIFCRKRTG
jgi:SAM-dependent methyltransferase